jgi:hypothetical protein
MDEQKVEQPLEPIKLKVIARRDAAMEALKNQGAESPRLSRGDLVVIDRVTGRPIANIQDVGLDFSGGLPRAIITIVDPQIDIHMDPLSEMQDKEVQADAVYCAKPLTRRSGSGPMGKQLTPKEKQKNLKQRLQNYADSIVRETD